MGQYTEDDILIVSMLDAIRKRPAMYIGTAVDPLANIVGEITAQFRHLGVSKHRMREEPEYVIIEAHEDWLESGKGNRSFSAPFSEWVRQHSVDTSKSLVGPRGEIYLTAFYFPILHGRSGGNSRRRELSG